MTALRSTSVNDLHDVLRHYLVGSVDSATVYSWTHHTCRKELPIYATTMPHPSRSGGTKMDRSTRGRIPISPSLSMEWDTTAAHSTLKGAAALVLELTAGA